MSQPNECVIWWIRRGLRLGDNPSLQAALATGKIVIPVYILDPALLRQPSPRRHSFLFAGLRQLASNLHERGSRLIVRSGSPLDEFHRLVEETGAQGIFAGEDSSPYAQKRDQAISGRLPLHLMVDAVAHHPQTVVKADGSPYTIFTPFSRAWKNLPLSASAAAWRPPSRLPPVPDLFSIPIPDGSAPDGFPAGESEALHRLEKFAAGPIVTYAANRDRLDINGTSSLSPYLHFGMLSTRQVFRTAAAAIHECEQEHIDPRGPQTWMEELIWREYYHSILYHFPDVLRQSFNPHLRAIAWNQSSDDLEAWQQGQTGFPVVDACMRQLLQTGWMHNRGRMIAASFLVKDLLINWQAGEGWFMRQLIDGDSAANNGGWQWTAGTGPGAAPYFRVFNPVLQGKKFDPTGDFIRTWVPQLAHLPTQAIHEPWLLGQPITGYPSRMVDHSAARLRLIVAYKASASG